MVSGTRHALFDFCIPVFVHQRNNTAYNCLPFHGPSTTYLRADAKALGGPSSSGGRRPLTASFWTAPGCAMELTACFDAFGFWCSYRIGMMSRSCQVKMQMPMRFLSKIRWTAPWWRSKRLLFSSQCYYPLTRKKKKSLRVLEEKPRFWTVLGCLLPSLTTIRRW